MSEPFLAEIHMVGFNFAPRGYALCDGQILPINQNQSLYSLLGTTYGGDGRTSFALPDLRGRVPVHKGNRITLGERAGQENVTLGSSHIPSHTHAAQASNQPINSEPAGGYWPGQGSAIPYTGTTSGLLDMRNPVDNAGGGHGHNNMQPYLALNFIIALQGLFPSRN